MPTLASGGCSRRCSCDRYARRSSHNRALSSFSLSVFGHMAVACVPLTHVRYLACSGNHAASAGRRPGDCVRLNVARVFRFQFGRSHSTSRPIVRAHRKRSRRIPLSPTGSVSCAGEKFDASRELRALSKTDAFPWVGQSEHQPIRSPSACRTFQRIVNSVVVPPDVRGRGLKGIRWLISTTVS